MTTLTETIRELRDLLKKATPGVWELDPVFGGIFVYPDIDVAAYDRILDAELTIAMRSALPTLLDAAEQCEAWKQKAERYERDLSDFDYHADILKTCIEQKFSQQEIAIAINNVIQAGEGAFKALSQSGDKEGVMG